MTRCTYRVGGFADSVLVCTREAHDDRGHCYVGSEAPDRHTDEVGDDQ